MTVALERELASLNPATLEVVGSVARTPVETVPELVAEARRAQERWGRTSLAERRDLMRSVSRVLLARADAIAETIAAETGKPLVEAFTTEVFVALDNAQWIGREVPRALAPERVRLPLHLRHKRGWIRHEPLGAVAVISPWNFPFSIPFTETAMAVAAGNAVLLKPAELTPLTGAWVGRVFAEAGAPAGLLQVLQGEGETVGEALVRADGIAKVFFTGSAEVGRHVAALCGERLRPVVLELGGKDPMLVFADADVERALDGALWGAFFNAGQVCSGVERIYVERGLHDRFVAQLAARAARLAIPDEVGPLISEEQRARVEELVATARDRVVVGGRRPERPGFFYEPTVIAGSSERLAREEIFGPVVTVEPFDGEDAAIRRANDSGYGLGASVWTRDRERARRVASQLQAGTVWTNDLSYSYGVCQAPWGGTKESGFGRTHSRYGFLECTEAKFVDADRGRLPVPWWYPYGPEAVDGFKGVIGLLYEHGLRARAAAGWRHRRGLARIVRRYVS
ncbi:MAG TPA: aldehyde dehydrogenase family protein [Gaiellaceae bacterium]